MRGLTLGQYLADKLALGMGSWAFLIIQTALLAVWVIYNIASGSAFDPYPFIFLNLMLSFQAAYAAPIIMMSSNRQEEIDRERSIKIYLLEEMQHENMEILLKRLEEHFAEVKDHIDQALTKAA